MQQQYRLYQKAVNLLFFFLTDKTILLARPPTESG